MDQRIEEIFKRCEEFIDSSTPEELAAYEESLNLDYEDYIIKGENMAKGIIVMDIPKSCIECELMCTNQDGDKFCFKHGFHEPIEDDKPDWCPIKPMPGYLDEASVNDDYYFGLENGWNDCIDAILEEVQNE